MWPLFKRFLIGKPLKTLDEGARHLSRTKALALLSSDALSSVAYGTEQIITVLVAVGGVATLWLQLPVVALVLVLLGAITLSYRQIIHAYPTGGGAYLVTSKNWGRNAGLVAGGSLLVDYMLTVAVSVASGTEAIISAIPALHPYNVAIGVIIILALTGINLRGLRESAGALMVPVYLFIVVMVVMIVWGLVNILTGHVNYQPTITGHVATGSASILLFLKAFSSGSSSLTGVEAISNAVPNFKEPKPRNASITLVIMATILAFFLVGVTFLSFTYGIKPDAHVTVLAQIGQQVFGHGVLFYVLQIATALILAVAANTGFSAFPQLAYNLARDKFMPHSYMDKGDRLGYSNGIMSLALGAIVLLVIFNGSTEALIPLYAVGVFVPFTLSQSGMIIHWWRERDGHWLMKSLINFVGALISAVLVVTLFALHFNSVWPYLIIMPILLRMFWVINRHYKLVAKQLRVLSQEPIKRSHYDGATVIVLVSNLTRATADAVDYAKSIGDKVLAMHVSFDSNPQKEHRLGVEFKREFPEVRYVDIHSSYRSITKPAMRFVDEIAKGSKERNHSLTILIPQFVPHHSWQNALHNQNSLKLRTALASRDITVSTYYFHLKE
ncbi:APC family permease [Weissella paramesenteroides]|jgi:amino acid transporter|uniref:Cation diffusion facilitator family transporter n=1 Tax=Weissella paramesenteroides ATCC 33313 TaxID=585506 RepID=C5R8D7_WEIPA|nr:APC family permease [Weissella paramesenteroides]ATF40775.1 APC family permease [Weissella paramesenteroides]EER75431.1 cation diffusion facilitator family transporter [Weissella paramesenteroides ATCC 33313]KAA8445550.1 APC family permease [Weissella paramesenteroides]KAA8451051.1 APC family permease [Weissella paramesenteroides]MBU7556549.1 APC family permease [Weissella paramesenteroides]